MAMIQGPGGFQPIQRQFKTGEAAPKQEKTQDPVIQDGFVSGGMQIPAAIPAEVKIDTPAEVAHQTPAEMPQPTGAQVNTRIETSAMPRIPAELDGQFLTGPGLSGLNSLSRIGDTNETAATAGKPFTNGLGSTSFIGLSGRVLAGAQPFGR